MKRPLLFIILALVSSLSSHAKEFLTSAQIQEILHMEGESKSETASPKKILFSWSKPDHPKHTHSYQPFAQKFSSSLSKIKNIRTTSTEGFPTPQQWESADLVVFNLTQSNLSPEQFATIDNHLGQGKAIVVVHQALVQRVGYQEWAQRIGLAFSWDAPPLKSKWGKGELEIKIDNQHPIFRGFPEKITVNDELYWNLKSGTRGKVSILGETLAPKKEPKAKTNNTKWPVFWTVEHPAKEGKQPGKVFCCVIGHPDEVAFSTSFQIIMMRAFAWSLGEPSGPFLERIANTEQETTH